MWKSQQNTTSIYSTCSGFIWCSYEIDSCMAWEWKLFNHNSKQGCLITEMLSSLFSDFSAHLHFHFSKYGFIVVVWTRLVSFEPDMPWIANFLFTVLSLVLEEVRFAWSVFVALVVLLVYLLEQSKQNHTKKYHSNRNRVSSLLVFLEVVHSTANLYASHLSCWPSNYPTTQNHFLVSTHLAWILVVHISN